MSSKIDILALLSANDEPAHSAYHTAIDNTVRDSQCLKRLIEDRVKDEILIHITTRGHRLAQFFHGLHQSVRADPRSSTTLSLATETANFLTWMLPDLDQLLEPMKVLELLVPSLEICFVPCKPPSLRKLASVLSGCGTLLEHLAADRSGSRIVRQWAYLSRTLSMDAKTQESWTGRMVNMVSSCPGYHNVAPSIQRWTMLIALKDALQILEKRLLEEEDNRAFLAKGQETRSILFSLTNDLKKMLETFELAAPESRRMVQSHIETLKDSETLAILRLIATSFPCKRCIPALGSMPRSTNAEYHDQGTAVISNLPIDILGEGVGIWKISLSGPALKSVRNLSRLGLFSPAREKFTDIASGCWKCKSAGNIDQKQHWKVPLRTTKCGKGLYILWQVDVGVAGDLELLQQVIVVWEVGDYEAISKAIDRVIHLQGSYADDHIARCRQQPLTRNNHLIPAHFDNHAIRPARSETPSVALDVRTADQDTIDMANKSYALTEPVIRSILNNDLAAEFPFDLSMEEARAIAHFQTASLILGRSGTGKTTCLVFKLVGKFLASKATLDERPARQVSSTTIPLLLTVADNTQVLLTRSSFLAEKIQNYADRLIETLLSKSPSSESFKFEEHLLSRRVEEDSENDSVLTLRDQSFPLICTFERFLRILENTIVELDRQNFENLFRHQMHGITSTRHQPSRQSVDFYAFKVIYWPRFSQDLTKDLPVNLVFAEIMGVIKGSVFSRQSLAPISREEYLTRSCRMAPTFVSEAERLCVYDIFGLYEKLKVERGDVDDVDRVVRILRAVRRDSSLRQLLRSTFDEIYVDEIQDHRCLDTELFLSLLKDVRGLHCASDTAQAISQDSTFRFSDMKRLFHEHLAEISALTKQSELPEPQMFTLSRNYRSHQEVLAVSSLFRSMICKGFPDTVDKLDPEVGILSGPKPVLFLGCDVDILHTRNVALSKLSERATDFGAEQVVLVRDTKSKMNLQDQVGNVALILTILESKGMEFEDVILWNILSECPDQVGVRSLNALKNNEDGFDPRKNGAMCSELKHMYVGVTRTCSQLSIVEGSESTAKTVLKLLTEGSSGPLVEVTRPSDKNFAVMVEALRPSSSVDPAAWSQTAEKLMRNRLFNGALMAFGRAGDTRGETKAKGFLKEEEGNLCNADDVEGFTRNMRVAIDCFLKVDMIEDAVRVLEKLGALEEAADKWYECEQYLKSALLFTKAGLHKKAAECHHLLKDYSEAAESLLQGRNYDQFVTYVYKYRQSIPSDTFRGYNLLCKLLLKQEKISPEFRKHAIGLLGSPTDQEACFVEYGMDEQLAELYTEQKRHKHLYDLLSRTGQLERALILSLSQDLSQSFAGVAESELLNLLDYVCAGQVMINRQQDSAAAFKIRSDHFSPNIAHRFEQWEAGHRVYGDQSSSAYRKLANMEASVATKTLTLQKIMDATAIPKITTLDDMPFEMMQKAIAIARDLVLKNDKNALSIMLILTGVWTIGGRHEKYVLLPWSPLHGALDSLSTTDFPRVAKNWVLDNIASTVLALNSRAKVLWNSKWRVRCSNYLSTGNCRLRNCQKLHKNLSHDDCSRMFEDILRVNSFFCDLASLYYQRVMSPTFQRDYLGIRRQWLERLLRELTFLSNSGQSALAIARIRSELLLGNKSLPVRSSLEGLLYFKLRTEWKDRSDFTALLEQMQVSDAFGPSVRSRFFRALSQKLHYDRRGSTQQQLDLLNVLVLIPNRQNASTFRKNLEAFIRDLDYHKPRTFRSLHSFTTVCESLATYLILKTCIGACVVAQSWIDLYRPIVNMAANSPEPLVWDDSCRDDRYRYQQCLMELTKGFCRVISRMHGSPSKINLLCSGQPHEALPLQKRNEELVAILIANIAGMSLVPSQVWTSAEAIFAPNVVQAIRPKTGRLPNSNDMIQKLTPALLKHNSKDALVLVIKDRSKGLFFWSIESQPGVKILPFNELRSQTPIPADARESVDSALSVSTDGPHVEYTHAEKDAVANIKQLWLSCSPRIKRRRAYISVPECRATAHFFNMSARCPVTVAPRDRKDIRRLLVLQGVSLSSRLTDARELLSRLQKDAMACFENVEVNVGVFESVDVILGRNREVEHLLSKAEEKMADESVVEVVMTGVPTVLEKTMKEVEDVIVGAESSMFETRKLIEAVSRKDN